MARLRSICIMIVLGNAITSRPAPAQAASVSLTHTVSVTVPARVKVNIANSAAVAKELGVRPSSGLALRISATQAWSLSIDASSRPGVKWSRDGDATSFAVDGGQRGIASGTLSPVVAATTIFIHSGMEGSEESSATESGISNTVLLTIVAQ